MKARAPFFLLEIPNSRKSIHTPSSFSTNPHLSGVLESRDFILVKLLILHVEVIQRRVVALSVHDPRGHKLARRPAPVRERRHYQGRGPAAERGGIRSALSGVERVRRWRRREVCPNVQNSTRFPVHSPAPDSSHPPDSHLPPWSGHWPPLAATGRALEHSHLPAHTNLVSPPIRTPTCLVSRGICRPLKAETWLRRGRR